jgi:hypothetical protein
LVGKLVSMLAVSPEVVAEYRRRYLKTESEIASSMAGAPIIRPPELVFIGTTSLYGVGSSQYNRIRIPCEVLGGSPKDELRFQELGRSESFGTSHFSTRTVQALVQLVRGEKEGQRVNSIFGEGVSPRMRKIREGLDLLGFPTDALLRHGRHRIVYGISLVLNLRDYLIGLDPKPDYLFPRRGQTHSSAAIVRWWSARWLRGRLKNPAVLEDIERHTLVHPIRHGARVQLVQPELPLFPGHRE